MDLFSIAISFFNQPLIMIVTDKLEFQEVMDLLNIKISLML